MKTKVILKQLWFLLSLPLLFGAKNKESKDFYYLPNTIGPFNEGENYSDTFRIGSNVIGKEVRFRIAIYFQTCPKDADEVGDWEFLDKKASSRLGEELSFPFLIPKEMVKNRFHILFSIAYQVDSISRVIDSHILTARSMKDYREEPLSLLSETIFEGQQTYTISEEGDRIGIHPIAKVSGVKEILEADNGTIPFVSSFLFSLYDGNNHKPFSIPNWNLAAKLEIVGEGAKCFASICDEYKSTYLGDVASFKLTTKEIKEGTYRFLLQENQYAVNRYSGFMRKTTALRKDEVFTRELHLPYQISKDKAYTMRLLTARREDTFNIPLLSTQFYCYQECNPFGSVLNSEYCVEEIL